MNFAFVNALLFCKRFNSIDYMPTVYEKDK